MPGLDPDHALLQALQLANSLAPVDVVARLAAELAHAAGQPVGRPIPESWLREALHVLLTEANAIHRSMSDLPVRD
jgi:hypothetical protein